MPRRRDENAPYWQQLREAERRIIEYAFQHGGNIRGTAVILGISPSFLSRRIGELGVAVPASKEVAVPASKEVAAPALKTSKNSRGHVALNGKRRDVEDLDDELDDDEFDDDDDDEDDDDDDDDSEDEFDDEFDEDIENTH